MSCGRERGPVDLGIADRVGRGGRGIVRQILRPRQRSRIRSRLLRALLVVPAPDIDGDSCTAQQRNHPNGDQHQHLAALLTRSHT